MSEEFDPITGDPIVEDEESKVIRTLRARLAASEAAKKEAEEAATTAQVDARSQLEREVATQRFMDAAGYPGMRDTVLGQIEGEITADKALQALEGLKLAVDKEAFKATLEGQPAPVVEQQPASSGAEDIARVASLGGQISAAASVTPESTFETDIAETQTVADVIALAEKHGFHDPS
jgi:hypothetical protein